MARISVAYNSVSGVVYGFGAGDIDLEGTYPVAQYANVAYWRGQEFPPYRSDRIPAGNGFFKQGRILLLDKLPASEVVAVVFEPKAIITAPPENPAAGDAYVTDIGATGSFKWQETTITLEPLQKIILSTPPTVERLVTNSTFALKGTPYSYRVGATRLIAFGGNLFYPKAAISSGPTVPESVPDGFMFVQTRNVANQPADFNFAIWETVNGVLTRFPLSEGTHFYNASIGRLIFFNGQNLVPVDDPFPAVTVAVSNINLQTCTIADIRDALDRVNGALQFNPTITRINTTLVLAGQTEKRENGYYRMDVAVADGVYTRTFDRLPPFHQAVAVVAGGNEIKVQRGDIWGGKIVNFRNLGARVNVNLLPVFIPTVDEVELIAVSANEADISKLKAEIARVEELSKGKGTTTAPDLTGYAKQSSIEDLQAQIVALRDWRKVDRAAIDSIEDIQGNEIAAHTKTLGTLTSEIAQLNTKIAALEGIFVVSESEPDDGADWRIWVRHVKDLVRWQDKFCLWVRNGGEAIEITCTQAEDMPIPTYLDAIEETPGRFAITLPGAVKIGYANNRAGDLLQVGFPAGVFSGINLYYLDSSKTAMRTGVRSETIASNETAHGLGRADAPSGAAWVRAQLYRADLSQVEYDFPLV